MELLTSDKALKSASELLSLFGLPVDDLAASNVKLWCRCEGDQVNSVAGLEVYGRYGLFRSLAVSPAHQGRGEASSCLEAISDEAVTLGVEVLYLLTNTAEEFFASRGFSVVERDEVPEEIRATFQFSSLCPATATVMMKRLGS